MGFGCQMIVSSGHAFIQQNTIAGETKQYFAILIQLSAEVRAILLNNICKILPFLCHCVILRTTANSAQNSVHAESQNCDMPSFVCT